MLAAGIASSAGLIPAAADGICPVFGSQATGSPFAAWW